MSNIDTPYKVNQKIVYPSQGVGTIQDIKEKSEIKNFTIKLKIRIRTFVLILIKLFSNFNLIHVKKCI